MHRSSSVTYRHDELYRQIETMLDPIRRDASLDDAERARRITDMVAAANARTLARRATREVALAG
jgi:hypothetical protein